MAGKAYLIGKFFTDEKTLSRVLRKNRKRDKIMKKLDKGKKVKTKISIKKIHMYDPNKNKEGNHD